MGQDSSTPIDESTPPDTLQSRTLDGIAKYINDGKAKRIVVMVGSLDRRIHSRSTDYTTDGSWHLHQRWHTRLSKPRHRSVRQPRAPRSSLRRSRLRHLLLPQEPHSLLHPSARALPRKISPDHHPLFHPSSAREGTPAQAVHAEHRLSGTRSRCTGRQDRRGARQLCTSELHRL